MCYGLGLPDLPRTIPSGFLTSAVAAGLSALAISSVQLVVGDALLPRFVVFGSALLIVPLGTLCVGFVVDRPRGLGGSRSVSSSSGTTDLVRELEAELGSRPERPAAIVASLSAAGRRATLPDDVLPADGRRGVGRRDRAGAHADAQDDAHIVDQAAALHESGVRVRSLSLFYEDWLGKLPLSELERVSLMFDIGEVHRRATRG